MKKTIIYFFAAGLLFASCKKETKDVSQIVKVGHPTITLIGQEVISTPVGSGTFSDPGAVAWDDIKGDSVPLSAPVSNNVDLTTPGFYSVTWEFTNSNGVLSYTTQKSRLILVTPVDPADDISGVYTRTNGVEVNVVKHGTGLYTTDNVGGVAGNDAYIFDVYFGVTGPTTIEVPDQPNPLGGLVHCENATLTMDATDTTIKWVVIGSGFGTALRTFHRN